MKLTSRSPVQTLVLAFSTCHQSNAESGRQISLPFIICNYCGIETRITISLKIREMYIAMNDAVKLGKSLFKLSVILLLITTVQNKIY